MTTFAAIDIGSNAIRMLVRSSNRTGRLETLENLRLPVRLGQDAFTIGKFSQQTMQMAIDAFLRFRQVADHFGVKQTRAVATSAMREAGNSAELIQCIERETGFFIEIISGEEEARLIHLAVKRAANIQHKTALLIDIGGGSVELTLSNGQNILSTESFKIGTVRLLTRLKPSNGVEPALKNLLCEYAASARSYLARELESRSIQVCLGTGGNIREMGKLRQRLFNKRRSDLVTLQDLERLTNHIGGMSVNERIGRLRLKPDRADVILPAMLILQMIAREAKVGEVLVPGVGLKDGLMLEMVSSEPCPRLPRRAQVIAPVRQMEGTHRNASPYEALQ